jgi:hypothetical protein
MPLLITWISRALFEESVTKMKQEMAFVCLFAFVLLYKIIFGGIKRNVTIR